MEVVIARAASMVYIGMLHNLSKVVNLLYTKKRRDEGPMHENIAVMHRQLLNGINLAADKFEYRQFLENMQHVQDSETIVLRPSARLVQDIEEAGGILVNLFQKFQPLHKLYNSEEDAMSVLESDAIGLAQQQFDIEFLKIWLMPLDTIYKKLNLENPAVKGGEIYSRSVALLGADYGSFFKNGNIKVRDFALFYYRMLYAEATRDLLNRLFDDILANMPEEYRQKMQELHDLYRFHSSYDAEEE